MADVNGVDEVEKLKAELEKEKKKVAVLQDAAEKSNARIKELEKGTGKKKDPNMVQYLVLDTCYWNETFYRMDDIADIPEGITPPVRLFEKISK